MTDNLVKRLEAAGKELRRLVLENTLPDDEFSFISDKVLFNTNDLLREAAAAIASRPQDVAEGGGISQRFC